MYKVYRYSVVYKVLDTRSNAVISKEFSIRSRHFVNYSTCQSEAVAIMRCPVPSLVKDKLLKGLKDSDFMKPFSSAYVIESFYVDDATYDNLLNVGDIKDVNF